MAFISCKSRLGGRLNFADNRFRTYQDVPGWSHLGAIGSVGRSMAGAQLRRGHRPLAVTGLAFIFFLAGWAPGARAQKLDYASYGSAQAGKIVYEGGCIACHGTESKGAPVTSTEFVRPDTFPDFTQCDQTTPEPNSNWKAVILHGGKNRALSQIMPAFGDLLTNQQVDDVIAYLRGFCNNDHHYPRGELNMPRALATEKAFPEDELVVSTAMNASGSAELHDGCDSRADVWGKKPDRSGCSGKLRGPGPQLDEWGWRHHAGAEAGDVFQPGDGIDLQPAGRRVVADRR